MLYEKKTQKRRDEIVRILNENGNVRVSDLSERFGISSVTIRKDLECLEQIGVLRRVRGGALLTRAVYFGRDEGEHEKKKRENSDLKMSIARATADLIQDGEAVLIHSGSTIYYVVEELKKKKELFVITNVFKVVEQLWECENITVFFLGGRVYKKDHLTVGESVINQMSNYSVDKLIISADGVDLNTGVTTSYHHREDYIVHQMIQHAKETVLVVDETKVGQKTMMRLADISEIDIMVTNRSEEKEDICREIEKRGVTVVRAE